MKQNMKRAATRVLPAISVSVESIMNLDLPEAEVRFPWHPNLARIKSLACSNPSFVKQRQGQDRSKDATSSY